MNEQTVKCPCCGAEFDPANYESPSFEECVIAGAEYNMWREDISKKAEANWREALSKITKLYSEECVR